MAKDLLKFYTHSVEGKPESEWQGLEEQDFRFFVMMIQPFTGTDL